MIRLFSKSKYTYADLFDLLGLRKAKRPEYLFYYQYFYILLYQALDTVFTPYVAGNKKRFVAPHSELVDSYRILINYFYRIREVPRIHGIPLLNEFELFDPLNGSYNRLLNDWKKSKDKFEDHKAVLENLLTLENVQQIEISSRLHELSKNHHEAIKRQIILQRSKRTDDDSTEPYFFPNDFSRDKYDIRIYHLGKYGDLKFTKKDSNIRMKIFGLFFNQKGDWVTIDQIAKKVGRTHRNIYQVNRDLRKLLKPHQHTIEYHVGSTSMARLVSIEIANKLI